MSSPYSKEPHGLEDALHGEFDGQHDHVEVHQVPGNRGVGDEIDRARILSMDIAVARRTARLHVPDPSPARDTMFAATAEVHGLTVVTHNVKDLELLDVAIIDPWGRREDGQSVTPGRGRGPLLNQERASDLLLRGG